MEPGIKTATGVSSGMPKMCRLLGAGNQAQREGETRLWGRGFGQAGEDTSTAALFSSLPSPGSKETDSLRCAWGCGGKEMPSGSLCPGPTQTPRTPSSPWMGHVGLRLRGLVGKVSASKGSSWGISFSGQREKRLRGQMGPEMPTVCANHH